MSEVKKKGENRFSVFALKALYSAKFNAPHQPTLILNTVCTVDFDT